MLIITSVIKTINRPLYLLASMSVIHIISVLLC